MKNDVIRPGTSAFTLTELMVVIMIIGILFAILMPAIGRARQAAARAQARQEMHDIVTAFQSYYSEYGRYPLQNTTHADKVYSNTEFKEAIELLRVADSVSAADMDRHNPKKIGFLSVREKSLNADGVFVDPWKNPYRVAADWNFDHNVTIGGDGYQTIKGRSVVAWSRGERGNVSFDSYHIKSWTDDPEDKGESL